MPQQTWNTSNLLLNLLWAPSSEFVSSSIPSWQISTAHAQPFRGARDLAFCLKVPLDSLLVWASSEGSGETVRMRRLAWTFAARIGDKYQIRLARPISYHYVAEMQEMAINDGLHRYRLCELRKILVFHCTTSSCSWLLFLATLVIQIILKVLLCCIHKFKLHQLFFAIFRGRWQQNDTIF